MLARVLTIAGSDSSGGAGIQADLKTFTVFGVYGMSAITALTAQNTLGVTGVEAVSPEFVRAQIDAVASDVGIDAAKTGMLANRADHRGRRCRGARAPHCAAGRRSGHGRAERRAAARDRTRAARCCASCCRWRPWSRPICPRPRRCSACASATSPRLRDAARRLVDAGAAAALVKGGHLDGGEAVDVFYDGAQLHELRAPRIAAAHTHGTGCMLAAAIAACLGRRMTLLDAVREAKRFISVAIAGGSRARHAATARPIRLAWLDKIGG